MLPSNQNADAYIQPGYTALPPAKEESPAEFTQALPVFLAQFPEFSKSKSKLEILHYCFRHYVSIDPELRSLPIMEKLAHAGKMADNFFGLVTGAKR